VAPVFFRYGELFFVFLNNDTVKNSFVINRYDYTVLGEVKLIFSQVKMPGLTAVHFFKSKTG
jgi:hypothetical protein